MVKKELRAYYKSKRDELSYEQISLYAKEFASVFLESDSYKTSNIISVYLAFGKELPLEVVIEHAFNEGKRVCVPVVIGNVMRMQEITKDSVYVKNRYGIREPMQDDNSIYLTPDLIVVPALSVNREGYRIGYGGGYYDRYLAKFTGKTIGFCLPGFETDDFLPDEFDVPVDEIIWLNE